MDIDPSGRLPPSFGYVELRLDRVGTVVGYGIRDAADVAALIRGEVKHRARRRFGLADAQRLVAAARGALGAPCSPVP